MPQITVHTYADLRQYTGNAGSVELAIESGMTVAHVLTQLGIPAERTKIIFVDSRSAGIEHTLQGGERIDVFSALGGG
jgi:sulfur carrier protein ThiS